MMEIFPCGSQASEPGGDTFTGTVWEDPIIDLMPPSFVASARVSFVPRARTYWHTHPLGQALYVVQGAGRVQVWGQPIREIHAGDVVWIPPGEKHWHGASPTTMMAHIALQDVLPDGTGATWLEPVTDQQYDGGPTGGE